MTKVATKVKKVDLLYLIILALIFSFISLLFDIKDYAGDKIRPKKHYSQYNDMSIGMNMLMYRNLINKFNLLEKQKEVQHQTKLENQHRAGLEDFVQRGIRTYRNLGSLDLFLSVVNDKNGIFNHNQGHLFVVDVNSGIVIGSSGEPESIGTNMPDNNGESLGQIMAREANENGVWINSHKYRGLYVVRVDNFIFGACYGS